MESGETAEAVEGETVEDRDSRGDSRRYEKAEQEADYNPEPVLSRYTKSARGSKESGRKKSRKSGTKTGRLKAIVNEQISEAKQHGIDETEYLAAHLHENIINYLEEITDKGAVTFIYHKGEFLIEENPGTYGVKEARNKLRLIGGQTEAYDSSTLETLVRELDEEVGEPAKDSLVRIAKNRAEYYDTIINFINGRLVKTDVYKVEVNDKEWKCIRGAKSTHDAGPFHVLTYDQLWSMPNSAFAFDHGPVIKKFILEEIVKKGSNNPSFYANDYTLYNKSFPSGPYGTTISLKLAA